MWKPCISRYATIEICSYDSDFLNRSQTCKGLRNQVIGLTDAFSFPDFILKAPIGKYDGNIYPAYFETVLQGANSIGKPPYHDQYIKPLTERVAPN